MKDEITISDKMKKVMDNGIRIFPKSNINHRFAVCIEDRDVVIFKKTQTVGEYKHTTKTINEAIMKSLDYVYDKITNKFHA